MHTGYVLTFSHALSRHGPPPVRQLENVGITFQASETGYQV